MQEILGFNSYYEEEKRYVTSDSQLSSQRVSSQEQRAENDTEKKSESSQDPVVEVLAPEVYSSYNANSSRDPFSGIWSWKLRVELVGRDGFEKLDVQIPTRYDVL